MNGRKVFVDSNIWLYAFVDDQLLTEDMQHGLIIDNRLELVNPFL